jgi:hypothetical protein
MKRVAATLGRQADDFIVGTLDKLDKVACLFFVWASVVKKCVAGQGRQNHES